jgi:GDP-L-fucose synthase
MILNGQSVWICGHRGLVGSALLRHLKGEDVRVLTSDIDLRDQASVRTWMKDNAPDIILMAAGKVGGISANVSEPGEFSYDNVMIAANVIDGAYLNGAQRLIYLGSSCIYPKDARQPLCEDDVMNGDPEPSNAAYAMAKRMGVTLCRSHRRQYGCDFVSVMPCNLYGPHDRFDEVRSHVIPALMMKMHTAKIAGHPSVDIWGSGDALREFLYVDDCSDAIIHLLKQDTVPDVVNIGSGAEISIRDVAHKIATVVGYEGDLAFDRSKPEGAQRKILDSSRLNDMGWSAKTSFDDGLKSAYDWYQEQSNFT